MNESTGSGKKRKALSATLAIAMVATMLLSGTLAFYFHTSVTNEFSESAVKKVAAHDDFIEGENKDVYVENIGDTKVYVRIKLTESFTLDGREIAKDVVHIPATNADPAQEDPAIGTGTGAEEIQKYFTWEMGGVGEGNDTPFHYFLSAKDPHYQEADTTYRLNSDVAQDLSGRKWTADSTWDKTTDAVLRYAPDCEVITMAQYEAGVADGTIDPTNYAGWVMDTDGWAYWTERVDTNSATGLLLNNVKVSPALSGHKYQYNIKVDFEAVDDRDIDIWTENKKFDEHNKPVDTTAASDKAKVLLNRMQPLTAAELDAKIAALGVATTKSAGAAKLYEEAKAQLEKNNPFLARRLAVFGDFAQETVAKKVEEDGNNDYYNKPLLSNDGTGLISDSDIDAGLKEYLIENYGSDGKLTRDQALSVWRIYQRPEDVTGGATRIESFAGLTAENFPNLVSFALLSGGINAVDIEELKMTGIEKKVTNLRIDGTTDFNGGVDLQGFDALTSFMAEGITGLTEVTNIPANIEVLSSYRTKWESRVSEVFDVSDFPNVKKLAVPALTTQIEGLDNLAKISFLYLRETAISGILDLGRFEQLRTLVIGNTNNFSKIIFPLSNNGQNGFQEDKFSSISSENSLVYGTFASNTLTCLDLSKTTVWDKGKVNISGMLSLKLAIRKEAQNKFDGWNTLQATGGTRFECEINSDGTTATLWKYQTTGGNRVQIDATDADWQALDAATKSQLPEGIEIVGP